MWVLQWQSQYGAVTENVTFPPPVHLHPFFRSPEKVTSVFKIGNICIIKIAATY